MKITKQKLQQIIQEELQEMQQEGELDEAFLDRIFGRSSEYGGLVSGQSGDQEINDKVVAAQNSLKDLGRILNKKNFQQLADKALNMSTEIAGLGSFANKQDTVKSEPIPQDIKRISMAESGYETYKNLRDDIKNALDKNGTPPDFKKMVNLYNKLVPQKDQMDLNLLKSREEQEQLKFKGKREAKPTYKYRTEIAKQVLNVLDQALIDPRNFPGTSIPRRRKSTIGAQGGVSPRE